MLLIFSVLVASLCFSVVAIKFTYGRLDLFEPLLPAVVAMLSLFSVRPFMMFVSGESHSYRSFDIRQHIGVALVICSLGVASYLVGYFLSSRAPTPKPNATIRNISPKRLHTISFIYVFLSFFLTLGYLGSDPIATLVVLSRGRSELISEHITVHSEYLFAAPLLLSCAAALLILGGKNKRLRIRRILLICLLVSAPIAFFYLVGTRRFMIPAIFVPLVSYFLMSRKRPKALYLILGIPVFLILSAIPYMRTEGAREQIGGFGHQLIYALTRGDIWRGVFLGPDTEMLPAFAVEVKTLNDHSDFFYGRAVLGDLIISPIPSALFPKPISARDEMLLMAFGSKCSAGPGGLCPDFSIIGTLYQDFWIPGVIIGMFFFGFFSRRIWLSYRVQPDNPFRICAASITTVFTLIIIRAGFMPAFQWSLYFFVPIVVGLYLSKKRLTCKRAAPALGHHARSTPQ